MGCVWTNSDATNNFQFIVLVDRVASSILFRIPLSCVFFSCALYLPPNLQVFVGDTWSWQRFDTRRMVAIARWITKNLRTLRPVWDLMALGVATGCRQQKPADRKTFRKSCWRQKGSWTRLGGRWSCEICFTVCSGFFVREFDNNKVWSKFVSCKFERLFSQCAFCIC